MKGNSSPSQSAADCIKSATANPLPFSTVRAQQSLFTATSPAGPGSINDGSLIRFTLIESIKQCRKSRAAIADEITRLTGRKFTEIALNKFTAESRIDYRWPAELTRAFCAATGDDSLLHVTAEAAGYRLIRDEELELLELGRQYLRRKRANEEAEMLEKRLAGVDL